ncbi:MAG TPA: Ku protein [Acidimicrobiales bacterium]|nr:Ku protein [Acidimicrobiales bacterium]
MARAIWTGSLSFGLVSVPVGLYSATEDKTVHFHQLQAGTADRVRNRRVNERTGDEVEYHEIVKGYDVGDGQFVVVTQEELEAAEPDKSRTIDVTDFVELDEIDPIYFQRTYYLAPQGEQARRAYALLLKVMADTKKVGIATFVMRNKEYLVSLRPGDDVLVLETMFFSDEVRDPRSEIEGVPVDADFSKREVETAKLLIDSMTAKFDPQNYRDSYRERVEELIERKRAGEEIVVEPAPRAPARLVDLADALERSVEAAKSRHRAGQPGPSNRRESASRGAQSARAQATRAASTGAQSSPPAKLRPAGADLSEMSKAELYDRATELDLPGRSKMSREELESALRAANSSRRRRAS